jgi:hypothetical protein
MSEIEYRRKLHCAEYSRILNLIAFIDRVHPCFLLECNAIICLSLLESIPSQEFNEPNSNLQQYCPQETPVKATTQSCWSLTVD